MLFRPETEAQYDHLEGDVVSTTGFPPSTLLPTLFSERLLSWFTSLPSSSFLLPKPRPTTLMIRFLPSYNGKKAKINKAAKAQIIATTTPPTKNSLLNSYLAAYSIHDKWPQDPDCNKQHQLCNACNTTLFVHTTFFCLAERSILSGG